MLGSYVWNAACEVLVTRQASPPPIPGYKCDLQGDNSSDLRISGRQACLQCGSRHQGPPGPVQGLPDGARSGPQDAQDRFRYSAQLLLLAPAQISSGVKANRKEQSEMVAENAAAVCARQRARHDSAPMPPKRHGVRKDCQVQHLKRPGTAAPNSRATTCFYRGCLVAPCAKGSGCARASRHNAGEQLKKGESENDRGTRTYFPGGH